MTATNQDPWALREEIRKACEVEFHGTIDQLERDLTSMTDHRNEIMQELEIHRADYNAWLMKADQPRPWWRRWLGIVEQRDFYELDRRLSRTRAQRLQLRADDSLDFSTEGGYEWITGMAQLIEERNNFTELQWKLKTAFFPLAMMVLGGLLTWVWMAKIQTS